MAVKVTKLPGQVRMKYEDGSSPSGSLQFKTQTLSSIAPDATDEHIHQLRGLLDRVTVKQSTNLSRVLINELTEE